MKTLADFRIQMSGFQLDFNWIIGDEEQSNNRLGTNTCVCCVCLRNDTKHIAWWSANVLFHALHPFGTNCSCRAYQIVYTEIWQRRAETTSRTAAAATEATQYSFHATNRWWQPNSIDEWDRRLHGWPNFIDDDRTLFIELANFNIMFTPSAVT